MLKLTPFLSGKQRKGLKLVDPGVILRLQSSPLAFVGTKAEQKQKMTAHRYTTGTGASMRHGESSPTRPCLPTSRRVSDGGRHRPIGGSSWGDKDADCSWPKSAAGLSHYCVSLGDSGCVKRREMLPRAASSSHRSRLLLLWDGTAPTQQQHLLPLRSQRGGGGGLEHWSDFFHLPPPCALLMCMGANWRVRTVGVCCDGSLDAPFHGLPLLTHVCLRGQTHNQETPPPKLGQTPPRCF